MSSCENCGEFLNEDTQPEQYRRFMCDECYLEGEVCTCGGPKATDDEHCDWCADELYASNHADRMNDERKL